jgi:hypothetical protein
MLKVTVGEKSSKKAQGATAGRKRIGASPRSKFAEIEVFSMPKMGFVDNLLEPSANVGQAESYGKHSPCNETLVPSAFQPRVVEGDEGEDCLNHFVWEFEDGSLFRRRDSFLSCHLGKSMINRTWHNVKGR